MNPNDDFDDFIERIEPMTLFEQREMILRYFAAVLEGLSTSDVRMLREHLRRRFPKNEEQDAIFEVIDGHLALRELKE